MNVSKARSDQFKAKTSHELEMLIREAAANGAKLIVTPEFSYVGYPDDPNIPDQDDDFKNKKEIRPYTEFAGSAMEQKWSALAKSLHVYLIIGYPIEGKAAGEINNTVTFWDSKGVVIARYNKMHLFGDEWKFIDAGNTPVWVDTPFGRVGLLICADIWGYGPVRTYMKNNVEIYAVSASWVGSGGFSYFTDLATDTGKTVLAANHTYFPDAGVIDGTGDFQSYLHETTGVAYGYVLLKYPLP